MSSMPGRISWHAISERWALDLVSTVGIGLDRSLEMVIALMAVLKTGAAYVPLDPDYPRDRLRYMSENASLAVVLTSASLADRFDAPGLPQAVSRSRGGADRAGSRPQSWPDRHACKTWRISCIPQGPRDSPRAWKFHTARW